MRNIDRILLYLYNFLFLFGGSGTVKIKIQNRPNLANKTFWDNTPYKFKFRASYEANRFIFTGFNQNFYFWPFLDNLHTNRKTLCFCKKLP